MFDPRLLQQRSPLGGQLPAIPQQGLPQPQMGMAQPQMGLPPMGGVQTNPALPPQPVGMPQQMPTQAQGMPNQARWDAFFQSQGRQMPQMQRPPMPQQPAMPQQRPGLPQQARTGLFGRRLNRY
jgi:hypothetical protein